MRSTAVVVSTTFAQLSGWFESRPVRCRAERGETARSACTKVAFCAYRDLLSRLATSAFGATCR
jgi:hypothetical protein